MIVYNFTQDELEAIWNGIEENETKYVTETSNWIGEYLQSKGYNPTSSRIFIHRIDYETDYQNPSSTDFVNAVKLYENLDNDVAPYVAASGAFWTAMVHSNLEYMQYRWPLGENPSKRIAERYLMQWSPSARELERNGLSRLWWAVHLTIDNSLEDKYELTRELMSNQDLMTNVLDREPFTPEVTKAFLKVMIKNKVAESPLKRAEIRALMKYVFILNRSIIIYSLREEKMMSLLEDYLNWYRKRNHLLEES